MSAIVPVRNGARALPALLQSLQNQTLARERYEVIVVDNGSSDATAEIAEAHGARVTTEPIANRARARNRELPPQPAGFMPLQTQTASLIPDGSRSFCPIALKEL